MIDLDLIITLFVIFFLFGPSISRVLKFLGRRGGKQGENIAGALEDAVRKVRMEARGEVEEDSALELTGETSPEARPVPRSPDPTPGRLAPASPRAGAPRWQSQGRSSAGLLSATLIKKPPVETPKFVARPQPETRESPIIVRETVEEVYERPAAPPAPPPQESPQPALPERATAQRAPSAATKPADQWAVKKRHVARFNTRDVRRIMIYNAIFGPPRALMGFPPAKSLPRR